MVRTSMLPVSGTTELSAMPSRTRPGPPRRRRCCQVVTANPAWRWRSIQVVRVYRERAGLRYAGFDVAKKIDAGRGRQGSNFGGVTIEELQAFEARCNSSDRKSTRLNSSHQIISYAVFCL